VALFGKRKDKGSDTSPVTGSGAAELAARLRVPTGDVLKMAREMQAQAMQTMQAAQQATAGGAEMGSNAWLRNYVNILSGPQPGFVRRCTCGECGAPKKLAAVTAYIYCDYCGSLADFDLHKACEGDTMPGPEYVQLVNGLQPQLKAAQASGDQDTYRALQRQIFAAYAANVPSAVSHRAKGDDAYREKYVAYMAEGAVARAFDPGALQLEEEMKQKVAALQWTQGPGGMMDMRVAPDGVWAMADTLDRQMQSNVALYAGRGVTDLDPDKASPSLYARMGWSGFCQGWIKYLSEDDAGTLLDRAHLRAEYVPVQPEGAEPRTCSGCGGQVHALPGAKVVVCDGCGKSLDVGSAALTCPGCGGSVTLPVGASNVACPFCRSDVARVGVV
jgi:DNA-directed RNA polymerase subunit RPC12/RpoP